MVNQLLESGYKQTELGTIPEDWDVKPLGEICDIISGGTPSTTVKEYWDGEILWCTNTDITGTRGKYLTDTQRKITKSGLAASSAILLPAGSLLLCSRATIGEVRIAKSPICTNQGFKSLACKPSVCNEYAYYKLLTLKSKLIEKGIGTTFLEVSKRDISELKIAIPSDFHEQSTIANALSDIDNLIEVLDKLIDKKKNIKLGAMQELLTGRKRLAGFNAKWELKSFGQLFRFLQSANNPWSDLSAEGEIGYIHYGIIHTTGATLWNYSDVDLPLISKSKVTNLPLLKEGDLVMVDASEDYSGLGKSIEIGETRGKVVAGLHTFALRGDQSQIADGFKQFLQFIPSIRASLTRLATGISVYGISKGNLKQIELMLPRVEEQVAIASVLSDLNMEIAALENRRMKYSSIKEGMMQQLLTGRIRLT